MIRLSLALVLLALPAHAGGEPDPDWPCIQRRQPQLSIAQVWSGPIPDQAAIDRAKEPEIAHLAQTIALRRTSLEDAEKMVADFAATADNQALVALFQGAFDHIQSTRNRVMAGITRYAHKQEELDQHIEAKRHEFTELNAAENQDFDAIDKVEEDIDWSTRIFQDRQQSLTYVCETSVILEQRAFSIGRIIEKNLKN